MYSFQKYKLSLSDIMALGIEKKKLVSLSLLP